MIDVNVHPTKMDIRINEPQTFFRFLQESVAAAINGRSLVTSMDAKIEKEEDKKAEKQLTREIPQPFEAGRRSQSQVRDFFLRTVLWADCAESTAEGR